MAVKLADAVAFLRTDDKELKSGLKQADTEVTGWAGKLSGAIGGAAVGIAAAAGVALVGATVAIGKAAVDISSEIATATADLGAQLGIQAEEAEKYADVATKVFGNNFADSVTDAADAIGIVAKQLNLTADDPSLQRITENAFRLRDVFGTDVNESVSAVKTLMANFGLTSEQAFDMLAKGYQQGLDRSGDFIDTIEEYSTQFANGGASAQEFFSLLDTGLAGGMLGTDKAADLFKEFRVRIQDGSDTTRDALGAIGLDADMMAEKFADGSLTAIDAFTMVQTALKATGDENTQFQAGVALLGSQFEDLGTSAVLGIDTAAFQFSAMEGTIDSLDAKYNTFGSMWEGMGRRLTVALAPLGDKLLELANRLMPLVAAAIEGLIVVITPLIGWIVEGVDAIFGFVDANQEMTNSFGEVGKSIESTFGPVISRAQELFQMFGGLVSKVVDQNLNYFNGWIAQNMPRIQQIVSTVLNAITGFWNQHGAAIVDAVQRYFGWIINFWSLVFRTLLNIVQVFLQVLTGDWEGAGQTLQAIVRDWWTTLRQIFSDMIAGIIELWRSVDWGGIGRAIVDGIWGGLRSAWGGLQSWFRDRLQEWRNMLPFSEPKDPSSPLRGLAKAGEAIVDQVRSGIERAADWTVPGLGLPQMATAAAAPMTITINISGVADAEGAGRASRDGVLAALRAKGMR